MQKEGNVLEPSHTGAEPADAFLPQNLSGPEDAPADAEEPAAAPSLAEQTPPDGAVPSALRRDVRALEAQLLGGERSLHRREVAASAGVSLLSARKIWRALGFPTSVMRTRPSPRMTKWPCAGSSTWSGPAN